MGERSSHSSAFRRAQEKQMPSKRSAKVSRALTSEKVPKEEDQADFSDAGESEKSLGDINEREWEGADAEQEEESDDEDGKEPEEHSEEDDGEEYEGEGDEEEDDDDGENISESEGEETVKKKSDRGAAAGSISLGGRGSSSDSSSCSAAKKSKFLLVSAEQSAATLQRRGEHIQRQIHVLSGLLSLRIRMNPILRLVSRLPSPGAFMLLQHLSQLREEKEQSQQQQQQQRGGGGGDVLGLEAARSEAAGLLVDCLSLQQLLLQQSSLQTPQAAAAEAAEDAISEEEKDTQSSSVPSSSETTQSTSWEGRRRRWWLRQQQQLQQQQQEEQQQQQKQQQQQQQDKVTGSEGAQRGKKRHLENNTQSAFCATTAEGLRGGDNSAVNSSSSSGCDSSLLLRVEGQVWRNVVDTCWRKRTRGRCLETADAWQAALDPQAQVFKVLKQPLSQQLSHAMTSQYERLLRRAIRTTHVITAAAPAAAGAAAAAGRRNASAEAAVGATSGCCEVVACQTLQGLCRRLQQQLPSQEISSSGGDSGVALSPLIPDMLQHEQYEDLDFYVELLKEIVKQGCGAELLQDSLSTEGLDRAKSLLKLRNKLNRRRVDVDRRASKGKKLRYQVIPKLQNFLTAVPWEPDVTALPGAAAAAGAKPGDACPIVDRLMRQLFAE